MPDWNSHTNAYGNCDGNIHADAICDGNVHTDADAKCDVYAYTYT